MLYSLNKLKRERIVCVNHSRKKEKRKKEKKKNPDKLTVVKWKGKEGTTRKYKRQ